MVTQEGKDGYFRWNEDICGCIQVQLLKIQLYLLPLPLPLLFSVTGSLLCLIAEEHNPGIALWLGHSLFTARPYSSLVRLLRLVLCLT